MFSAVSLINAVEVLESAGVSRRLEIENRFLDFLFSASDVHSKKPIESCERLL